MSHTPLPLVTILTPTYNRAAMLPEVIESVLAQSYPNIEYIVLDDGSADATADVVAQYQQRYPERIHYHHHNNRGEAETVNRGWQMAAGEYVMVINSDDPQPPHLVARSVEVMQANPNAAVTYPDWEMIDDSGMVVREIRLQDFGFQHMVEHAHCFIGPGALLNRRLLIERLPAIRDKKYSMVSDFYCWLKVGLVGQFVHIPEPIARWRSHPNAATAQHLHTMMRQQFDLLQAFFSWEGVTPAMQQWQAAAYSSTALLLAREQWKAGDYKASLQLMMRAVCRSPARSFQAAKKIAVYQVKQHIFDGLQLLRKRLAAA